MTELRLSFRDIIAPGASVHLTRATLAPTRPKMLHTHDFYEMFWVQNGQVRHHTLDGSTTLAEGTVVFMRPDDHHALQGKGDHALVVSIAFHPNHIWSMSRRHTEFQGHLFWADAPVQVQRTPRDMVALNQSAMRLEQGNRDRLALEAFVLPLAVELIAQGPHLPADAPEWLVAACTAAHRPDVFRQGAAGLVAATGKAHPHVSRTMMRFAAQSPSAYINGLRMKHAARALVGSGDTIAEIATEIGVPNLSHFHKLFRAHFGATPAQYRIRYQRHVVQPLTA